MKFILAYYLLTCGAVFIAQATLPENQKDKVTDWLVFPMLLLTWPIFEVMKLGHKARKYFCE